MKLIVPVGTMGKAISLRVKNPPAQASKVVKQIETPRSSNPIMRRPGADREEKRVTRGGDTDKTIGTDQKQLDHSNPNQRRLSDRRSMRQREL